MLQNFQFCNILFYPLVFPVCFFSCEDFVVYNDVGSVRCMYSVDFSLCTRSLEGHFHNGMKGPQKLVGSCEDYYEWSLAHNHQVPHNNFCAGVTTSVQETTSVKGPTFVKGSTFVQERPTQKWTGSLTKMDKTF